ncbi:hypothetical protein TRIP_E190217 [uncultured Spirochaetota bacterium]|nr:hypothetical protein TRIP_E190217 [uncultured Spirochaetota bacterium]
MYHGLISKARKLLLKYKNFNES